ncbi:MAG: hypothetical protein LBI92_02005 [Azoarcus sp.]|jgi:hypothetical protein|nr:hypothetical protein [Azoarcus sp.]
MSQFDYPMDRKKHPDLEPWLYREEIVAQLVGACHDDRVAFALHEEAPLAYEYIEEVLNEYDQEARAYAGDDAQTTGEEFRHAVLNGWGITFPPLIRPEGAEKETMRRPYVPPQKSTKPDDSPEKA